MAQKALWTPFLVCHQWPDILVSRMQGRPKDNHWGCRDYKKFTTQDARKGQSFITLDVGNGVSSSLGLHEMSQDHHLNCEEGHKLTTKDEENAWIHTQKVPLGMNRMQWITNNEAENPKSSSFRMHRLQQVHHSGCKRKPKMYHLGCRE